MSPELIGAYSVVFLLVLMFIGFPVWFCLLLTGIAGFALISGLPKALGVAELTMLSTVRDYTFAVLPAFLLMGEFADMSGMMKDAYDSANTWLSEVRGGLAMASIVGAAAFSCISGSSMACAAIMTRVALPRLLDHKYDPELATGALAAGGTLGNLIPPGIYLVIYAVIAEVSLGKLFVACYIPGFLLMFMYMAQILIQCTLKRSLAPAAGRTTLKEKSRATLGMLPIVVALLIVFGGIEIGVFTPNEAASVATVLVFIFALARRTVNGKKLSQAFLNTLFTTGMALAILIGANVYNVFVAMSGMAQSLGSWLISLSLSSLSVIILIMVLYTVLGIPMGAFTILLLTLPILLPILKAYNIDLIWFGVLAIVQCELANLTPPVGMNLFVVSGMVKAKGISMVTVFRGAIPFCVTCLAFNVLLIAFPQISTFLVTLMK
jgi:tripartite ATP-independent transporter DctM subunit